jgi:Ni/Co efflux regulator RcnB
MRRLLFAASAALVLALPGLSLAQDEHPHEGGGRPEAGARPQGAPHAPPAAPSPRSAAPQPGHGLYQTAPLGRGPVSQAQGGRPFQSGPPPRAPQDNRGFAGGQPPGGYRNGGSPPGGRAGSQAFAYGGHQYFRYRAPPYRFPGGYYGWANHNWRQGEWLPSPFITSAYFINDWYDFGLWQPDYGYEWIRVGADAVLVNLTNGQVVDVVPGVYYY